MWLSERCTRAVCVPPRAACSLRGFASREVATRPSDFSARGCGYTASGWSEAPAAGVPRALRRAVAALVAPVASSPRCWWGCRWGAWWWSAADVRYGCASRMAVTATIPASDQRACCVPALAPAGVGSAGWGRGRSGQGAGVGCVRGSARARSAAWVGQARVLRCVVRFRAATCVLSVLAGANIARGEAPALSITRSAIVAEEAAGPGCRAGALCAA